MSNKLKRNIFSDRVIYTVTNLNDEGEGSLRYGLKVKEPVYIIFSVSGIIKLKSRLWIYRKHCTIDGENAPGPVIITGETVYVRGHDVTIRFITMCCNLFNEEKDSLWILLATSVLVEYCTIFGGTDEIASVTKSNNVTIKNCLIGFPLNANHGFGTILSGFDDNSVNYVENCMFVHCTARTPNMGLGNTIVTNNLIYNYGHLTSYTTNSRDAIVIMVGNTYVPGPQTIRPYIFMFPSRPSLVTAFIEENEYRGEIEIPQDDRIKNKENGILLDYEPSNGRFKILPQKEVYLNSKEQRKLYQRLDKLAINLIFEDSKNKSSERKKEKNLSKQKLVNSERDFLNSVGNWKHRTKWDFMMLDDYANKNGYIFPAEAFILE